MPSSSRTFHIAYTGLLLSIFLAPIPYGSNREWAEASLLLFTCTISLIVISGLYRGAFSLPTHFSKALPFQGCFLFLTLLQIIQLTTFDMADLNHASTGLLLSLTYWLLFNLVLILCQHSKHTQTLLWAVVLSGLFQAFYGSMMVLSGIEWSVISEKALNKGLATGTFINRNHLAGYLEISLACGLGLLIAQLKDVSFHSHKARLQHYLQTLLSSKIILRLILCMLVIALVMTRSRMGNTAFFSSMLICGALHLFLMQKFTRSAVILFVSLLIIDTLIVSQWFGLQELANRMNLTLGNVELVEESTAKTDNLDSNEISDSHYRLVTGDDRDKAWRQARPMIKDAPLLGVGYGNFYSQYPQYRDGSNKGYYDFAHNDYLQFIIEFGFLGAAGFLCLAVLALNNAIRSQLAKRNSIAISAAFASMMGITSLALHSWTDFNLYIPANAMLITLLLALSVLARWQKH